MFGISFSEITLIAVIALVVVGPQKLPGMLRTLGEWLGKLRRLTSDMRAQTGIDDILREEGIDGVAELRSLLRGEHLASRRRQAHSRGGTSSAYEEMAEPDTLMEYPVEGPDIASAIPDDLCSPDLSAAHRVEAKEPLAGSPEPAAAPSLAAAEGDAASPSVGPAGLSRPPPPPSQRPPGSRPPTRTIGLTPPPPRALPSSPPSRSAPSRPASRPAASRPAASGPAPSKPPPSSPSRPASSNASRPAPSRPAHEAPSRSTTAEHPTSALPNGAGEPKRESAPAADRESSPADSRTGTNRTRPKTQPETPLARAASSPPPTPKVEPTTSRKDAKK